MPPPRGWVPVPRNRHHQKGGYFLKISPEPGYKLQMGNKSIVRIYELVSKCVDLFNLKLKNEIVKVQFHYQDQAIFKLQIKWKLF